MTPAQELKALLLLRRLVAAWARDYHCCWMAEYYHCCWMAERGGGHTDDCIAERGGGHTDDCPWAAADEFLKEIGA